MFVKMLLKKILPSVVGVVLLVLAALWLYGYCGVKFGWIGVTDYPSLNAVSHHGGETAGGTAALLKSKVGI